MRATFPRLPVIVLVLAACGGSGETREIAPGARSELRRARLRAFFAPRTPAALVRLGRARLAVWDEEGAEEAFRKAWRIDEARGSEIGDAYLDAAKAIVERGPSVAILSPVVSSYVSNASRWSQRNDARRWLLALIARLLPRLDPEKREEAFRVAARLEEPRRDGQGLLHYVGEGLSEASSSGDHARWFTLLQAVDRLSAGHDNNQRTWVAAQYVVLAKRAGLGDPGMTRYCLARAQELDVRWTNDYELLALRSRLPAGEGLAPLSEMQKTASQLIQIVVAASKYSRERGGYPPCDSMQIFLVTVQSYSETQLSAADAWGGMLECSVAPHRLYIEVYSPGPDGRFNRGERISAWEAMHITDRRDQADLYIEHGYVAPPWWSQEDVLAFYR